MALPPDPRLTPYASDALRHEAVRARDVRADGLFLYAVRTTGIYCRPSCASRRARPENITFHANAEAAEQAGYRPCKRCCPRAPSQQAREQAIITQACRLIESADTAPALQALADAVGLSAHHFHRLFRRLTGVTPKAYATQWRANRLAMGLQAQSSVTAAIHDTGFGASSRFYDAQQSRLGMTPGRFRAGGAGEQIRFAVGQCQLGAILVAATQRGICALFLGDTPEALIHDLEDRFPHAELIGNDPSFDQTVAIAVGMVNASSSVPGPVPGPVPGQAPGAAPDLPLDIRGTAFQQRVWQALQRIPPGTTTTYTAVAAAIGQPGAARAVASACAANPVALMIPCHRVIRRDGSLSGYRWGLDRKARLLAAEAQRASASTAGMPLLPSA